MNKCITQSGPRKYLFNGRINKCSVNDLSVQDAWRFFVVQLLNHSLVFLTLWTATRHAPLFYTVSWNLLQFMFIELVMLSNHLILCAPFFFCFQSFPVSGSFQMSQFLASGGQSIGASASAWVLPMFPIGSHLSWFLQLGYTDILSLATLLWGLSCADGWQHPLFPSARCQEHPSP